LSDASRRTAGVLLLALVTVETGGYYLTTVARGMQDLTDFQVAFARAGHAHAGVLLILSLVALILADGAGLAGRTGLLARSLVPVAAILMPAGFFFSSMGQGRSEPNGFITLLWIGALTLAAGLILLGVLLLRRPRPAP
jgi:Ni,Fe-hydrogenase I cytochrome b subunit